MKITTTLEVSKQEKNIIYNALEAYIIYLNKILLDSQKGSCEALISETLTQTNRLISEMEVSM